MAHPAQKSVAEIEKSLMAKKDWKLSGEVRASARPKDSLLSMDMEFDTTIFNLPISADQNNEITRYVTQRFRERTFDNHEFKETEARAVEEFCPVELCETNREIIALYEKIENALKRLTDYGSDGFF